MSVYQSEAQARRLRNSTVADAKERAELAATQAKTMLRRTVEMAANAVNGEMGHAPNSQAIAAATVQKDDIDATCATIEQYLDDLLFQPLQLLAREADPDGQA